MPVETMNDCLDCNYIKETVCKIDKLQKEVITVGENRCISCETSLFNPANNTIPVAFYGECGNLFTGLTDLTGTTTSFFRIESIRCGRFVTLRLLTQDGDTLTATLRTMVLDLDSVKGIQCFEPITVELCTASTPAA
ncbi:MAG: hypothetical protein K2J93_02400 [Anaeroplasmataceae bacterium]|nr:hypothetical protein [Anaeroplasmataceae bacterium]